MRKVEVNWIACFAYILFPTLKAIFWVRLKGWNNCQSGYWKSNKFGQKIAFAQTDPQECEKFSKLLGPVWTDLVNSLLHLETLCLNASKDL